MILALSILNCLLGMGSLALCAVRSRGDLLPPDQTSLYLLAVGIACLAAAGMGLNRNGLLFNGLALCLLTAMTQEVILEEAMTASDTLKLFLKSIPDQPVLFGLAVVFLILGGLLDRKKAPRKKADKLKKS